MPFSNRHLAGATSDWLTVSAVERCLMSIPLVLFDVSSVLMPWVSVTHGRKALTSHFLALRQTLVP